LQTTERECDHTIELYTKEETIETTAEHPFYTTNGWKDAADLQAGDKIITQNDESIEIIGTKFNYEAKQVYNFEVADWHTYFVGVLAWLVHNANGKCISAILKELRKFGTKKFLVGKINIVLDNKGLKHILERHHPKFFQTKPKTLQSFFPKNTTVKDIERGIGEVIKQNREKILKNGVQRGQIEGIVDGVKRTVGFNKGRVGQYY
jgi:Pretoxin HINT domain